jgi:hypothetical protein
MAVLFPFANVGRISPIITHCADYVELFMRTYITELVRELYELLEGYALWWSTKVMDTRVSDTLARFTPPRRLPQDCLKVSGQASLSLLEKQSAA